MIDQHAQSAADRQARLARVAKEEQAYLTTFGRTSGKAHEVMMWFAVDGEKIYLLSDNQGETEWVSNILSNPEVSIRIGDQTFAGMARPIVNDAATDTHIRHLLTEKYHQQRDPQDVEQWASDALPIVIDL